MSVRIEVEDHVAVVTLDRPPVNAVDHATLAELTDAFRGLDDERDVRVAIFTAAGDRAFMAGLDLRAAAPPADEVPARFVTDAGLVAREPMWAIVDCAVPVIGAINGPALGAGLAFAACCDILIAADTRRSEPPRSTSACWARARTSHAWSGDTRHARCSSPASRCTRRRTASPRRGARSRAARRLLTTARDLASSSRRRARLALRLAKESMNRVEDLPLRGRIPRRAGLHRRACSASTIPAKPRRLPRTP